MAILITRQSARVRTNPDHSLAILEHTPDKVIGKAVPYGVSGEALRAQNPQPVRCCADPDISLPILRDGKYRLRMPGITCGKRYDRPVHDSGQSSICPDPNIVIRVFK